MVYGDQVKICDFGMSKYFIDRVSSNNEFYVQSLFYRSPEVTLKKKYNFKADVWSIGAIILDMLGYDNFFSQRDGFILDATHLMVCYTNTNLSSNG